MSQSPAPRTQRERTPLEDLLFATREQLLRFVQARIADPDLAEDVLQDALLKAVAASPTLHDEERLAPWLYRILRNEIVDAYRRRDVRRRHTEALGPGIDPPDLTAEEERALCACLRPLLPTLTPEQAEVLEAVDLGEEAPAATAARLGITVNNLKVRRHRARRALRERLEQACGLCATHGCLDCTCGT